MVRFSVSVVLVLCIGVSCAFGGVGFVDDSEQIESDGETLKVQEVSDNGEPYALDDSEASFHQRVPLTQLYAAEAPPGVPDWPAPSNISVQKYFLSNTSLVANFELTWNISPRTDLIGFRPVICTNITNRMGHVESCVGWQQSSETSSYSFSESFNTVFNVTVVALFKSPDSVKVFEKRSITRAYDSGVGPPGLVETITPKRENNTVNLSWDPPASPNQTIDYYVLDLSDALNSTSNLHVERNVTNATLSLAGMSTWAYELGIQAVNIDNSSGIVLAGPVARVNLVRTKPESPSALKLVSRTVDSLTVKISPPSNQTLPFTPYYKITASYLVRSNYVTDEVVFVRLQPYTQVTFGVSTCLKTAHMGSYVCGEAEQGTAFSNVAAPSRVNTLNAEESKNGGTVLTWTLPYTPNGPIDGFMVYATSGNKVEVERTVHSKERSYTFAPDELTKGKSYTLSVAAFNKDLQKKDVIYIGDKASVFLSGPGSWITVVIVLSVLVVLGAVGAGGYYYVRTRRARPQFLN